MLNARGGFESDLTIVRVAPAEFFIVTGSAQTTRDFAWIERAIGDDEHAVLVDVTSAYSVLSVMGPKAEALLGRLSPGRAFPQPRMPFATTRMIDVGYARVRAARMSYVGGPGYELYVPADQCVTLYDALWSCGAEFGLRDAGYYTIDALRIEAGRRAWGAELSPDETPWEAGPRLRREDGQARRVRRPRRARAAAGRGHPQAPRHVHLRRSRRLPVGRRTDPDGRQECRRIDVDRLLAAATGARSRWATRAPTARSPTTSSSARVTGSTLPASSTP